MLQTVCAVVRQGRIELLEEAQLPEGVKLLVTVLPDKDENQFWLRASEFSVAQVWDSPEDEVYAQLLPE